MEHELSYGPQGGLATGTRYLNIARDLSRINSKNEEITTRDGHVYGYLCEFTLNGGTIGLYRAPNSWKMRNAFRKFHAYRNIMFENAGVSLEERGRYGKTMRPYLDLGHASGTELVPQTFTSSAHSAGATDKLLDGGEWTYSKLAVTPTYHATVPVDPTEEYWADAFELHICEENKVQGSSETESGYYKSVGMIHSYNIDRQEVTTPRSGDDEAITGPSNPLAQLISSGNQAVGEVIEITEDQELEFPPYDLENDGDSIFAVNGAFVTSTSEFATVRFTSFIPAGLARIVLGGPTSLNIRVLDKILCKDMA